jgi:hypothetical protein
MDNRPEMCALQYERWSKLTPTCVLIQPGRPQSDALSFLRPKPISSPNSSPREHVVRQPQIGGMGEAAPIWRYRLGKVDTTRARSKGAASYNAACMACADCFSVAYRRHA